jgi:hypothetical protein
LRDWNYDYKNHGPYPNYPAQGSYTLTTPPLRPGNTYFLGFEASSDAIFSMSCSTNGGLIDFTSVPFYNGYVSNNAAAFGVLKYRIDVPSNAERLVFFTTNSSLVSIYLDQGSVPTMTTSDDWYTSGNASFNEYLEYPDYWPWQPGYSYFLEATNTSSSPQPFVLSLDGEGPGTAPPQFSSVQYLSNHTLQLNIQVTPGESYDVEVSTDLIHWTVLTSFTPTSTIYSYIDYSPTYPWRYYRLVEQ